MQKKITEKGYYALICTNKSRKTSDWIVSGVYPTRKEAQEANKEVEGCLAKHLVKKVELKITFA